MTGLSLRKRFPKLPENGFQRFRKQLAGFARSDKLLFTMHFTFFYHA